MEHSHPSSLGLLRHGYNIDGPVDQEILHSNVVWLSHKGPSHLGGDLCEIPVELSGLLLFLVQILQPLEKLRERKSLAELMDGYSQMGGDLKPGFPLTL